MLILVEESMSDEGSDDEGLGKENDPGDQVLLSGPGGKRLTRHDDLQNDVGAAIGRRLDEDANDLLEAALHGPR